MTKQNNNALVDTREPKLGKFAIFTIYKLIGFQWINILIGSICNSGIGVVQIIFFFIIGGIVDVISVGNENGQPLTPQEIRTQINYLAMWIAIVAVISLILNLLTNFFLYLANERIGSKLKQKYFDNLLEQEIGFFDIKKTGALTSPMFSDVSSIQDAYTVKLSELCKNIVQAIIGIILSFRISWKLSLVTLSTAPLIAGLLIATGRLTVLLIRKTIQVNAIAFGTATEAISAVRTVRSMGGEDFEKDKFHSDLTKIIKLGYLKAFTQGALFGSTNLVMWGTCALSFWYGGTKLFISGEVTAGNLYQMYGYTLNAVLGIGRAFTVLPDFQKANASAYSLLKIIKRKPAIPYSGGKVVLGGVKGNVKFEKVSFAYPSRPNAIVLKEFSMNILPGQSVAIVGPSGSGKSTIIGLLEKFYKPTSGNVYLDGVDINEIDPKWLHKSIAIVSQEPVLFGTTIAHNIAYAVGLENVTQKQIEDAAKEANAHNFIMDLPDGYNTKVSEKGVSLSGGQKQRIAIARAVLQNPNLLLLDEATSALDTESEAMVQESLNRIMKGRTSICIAHRLTTIKNCDHIYVLEKGELKEEGVHDELLKIENGVYRKFAEKQMKFGENTPIDTTDEIHRKSWRDSVYIKTLFTN